MGNHTSAFRFRKLFPKHIISIINVYAPINQLVRDDVSVPENFYNDVSAVLNELKNKSLLFLTGDWNAKIRKKRSSNIPMAIVLVVMLVLFEMAIDNILSISG